MIFVSLCAIAALLIYILGYTVGKLTAEAKIQEQRNEMQLNEKESDPYDELYKQ